MQPLVHSDKTCRGGYFLENMVDANRSIMGCPPRFKYSESLLLELTTNTVCQKGSDRPESQRLTNNCCEAQPGFVEKGSRARRYTVLGKCSRTSQNVLCHPSESNRVAKTDTGTG
jgi:hypothetical protein